MIEWLNQAGEIWLSYFGLALIQNTVFVGIIFLLLYWLRQASAQIKYWIGVIGLLKLILPPFLPESYVMIFFQNNTFQSGLVSVGEITPVLGMSVASTGRLDAAGALLLVWMITLSGYLLLAAISTFHLHRKLSQSASRYSSEEIATPVPIYQSSHASVPLSVGIFPKRIFLPPYWSALPAECQQVLLGHEVAHIKRRDGLVQFLQIIIQAIYFFHPLVWMLNERLNEYREMACDDSAIADAKLTRLTYSRYLVFTAEKLAHSQWSHISATALIRQRTKLMNRVNYQLKEKIMHTISNKKLMVILGGLLLLILPFSWYSSQPESMAAAEATKTARAADKPAMNVGKITGTVTNQETGKPLAGVNITVVGSDIGAATDQKGRYFVRSVPPGKYQLTASHIGFKTVLVKEVAVKVNATTTLNFVLEPVVIEITKLSGSSTAAPPATDEKGDSAKFVKYDIAPQPVGGFKALQKNLIYPEEARKHGVNGTIFLQVHIDAKGEVKETKFMEVKVIPPEKADDTGKAEPQSVPPAVIEAMKNATIEAVKKTKWQPAMQRDKPVDVWVSVPFEFKLK